jgi:hypothetical protein
MPKSRNLGKIAYEGYHGTRHRDYEKTWPWTPFDEITQGEKENWDDAADAVWDLCQADASVKGETVSREGALQASIGAEAFGEWQKLMRKAINVQNGIATEEERQIVAEALLRRLDREGLIRNL